MDQQAKLNFIQYGPIVCACLSLLGSTLTIITVYRTHCNGVQLTTYHRLILGICIFDLVFSTAFALGPLPAPAVLQGYGFTGAHGNLQTCTAQGFFILLGNASFAYTTMLMWYYVLVVVLSMKGPQLLSIEPLFHAIPTLFYGIAALVGLLQQTLNFSGAFCFIGTWPLGCLKNPDVPCQRGENIKIFSLWVGTLPILLWNILSALALLVLGVSVLAQYQKKNQWDFLSRQQQQQQQQQSAHPTSQANNRMRRRASFYSFRASTVEGEIEGRASGRAGSKSAQRQVLIQCSLYGLQFLNVAIWVSIVSIANLVDDSSFDAFGDDFWLFAMALLMFPLQGFFLFLIYMRPNYANARALHRNKSRWECFCGAVWNPAATSHRSSRHVCPRSFHDDNISSGSTNSQNNLPKESGVMTEQKDQDEPEEELDTIKEPAKDEPVLGPPEIEASSEMMFATATG